MFKSLNLGKPKQLLTKLTAIASLALLLTTTTLPHAAPTLAADEESETATPVSQVIRLSGDDRYGTALAISIAGWDRADAVVLARGDKFPDALAGAVLAQSQGVQGPLLLTRSNSLLPEVLSEIKRLEATKVYILGGTTAISASVEQALTNAGIAVERVEGSDRYATAANIARKAVSQADEAFIATGADYPDALSIASYAAANHIPLLLTHKDNLPEVTKTALKDLGVKKVTLIGGESVISANVKQQLENLTVAGGTLTVDRLYGNNRYETNSKILKSLIFDHQTMYLATGTDFPDALAGAAIAATGNNPILLLPKDKPDSTSTGFLSAARESGATFVILGGWSAISYSLENIIRTGVDKPRVSLQYLQYKSNHNYQSQIKAIPDRASDYVDFVVPNWLALDAPVNGVSPGTFSDERNLGMSYQKETIALAHERGLRILPMIASIGSISKTDSFLKNPEAQARFISDVQAYLQTTGADGIVIDFESMSDDMGDEFAAFMQSLYSMMQGENKILVVAVPAKLKSYTWYEEFNYRELSKYCDYMNIMTYDLSTSTPGAIAPLDWVEDVLKYTATQVSDMSKVLLGIPYYGRNWTENKAADGKVTYSASALNYTSAMALAEEYGVSVKRFARNGKGVGVPYFNYTDKDGKLHHVYFEDGQSWEEKLKLLNAFGLGGVGCWSHYWIDDQAGEIIYPLLKAYLR